MSPIDPLSQFSAKPVNRSESSRSLKDLVRNQLGLDPDTSVFVAEVTCGETDCPDAETVIAIFTGEGRKEVKISKAMEAVTAEDISAAWPD